jgi:hypothetical protein
LKGSSKKKRSREEMEDVKEEEKLLHDDKQKFLQNVKKLRQEKKLGNDELVELKAIQRTMEGLER